MNVYILANELERLADTHTMFQVLSRLANVCYDKAAYVEAGGSHGAPSPYLAAQWRAVAKTLDKAADKAAGL